MSDKDFDKFSDKIFVMILSCFSCGFIIIAVSLANAITVKITGEELYFVPYVMDVCIILIAAIIFIGIVPSLIKYFKNKGR